jgi:hypothetical protein
MGMKQLLKKHSYIYAIAFSRDFFRLFILVSIIFLPKNIATYGEFRVGYIRLKHFVPKFSKTEAIRNKKRGTESPVKNLRFLLLAQFSGFKA